MCQIYEILEIAVRFCDGHYAVCRKENTSAKCKLVTSLLVRYEQTALFWCNAEKVRIHPPSKNVYKHTAYVN